MVLDVYDQCTPALQTQMKPCRDLLMRQLRIKEDREKRKRVRLGKGASGASESKGAAEGEGEEEEVMPTFASIRDQVDPALLAGMYAARNTPR